MNVAELFTENIVEHDLITESLTYLQDHGYQVDESARYAVVSDSGHGYVVSKVGTHTVPFARADAVEDQYELWACTCHSYRYHAGLPDLEQTDVTQWEPCKHIKACVKEVRAKADDQQTELES